MIGAGRDYADSGLVRAGVANAQRAMPQLVLGTRGAGRLTEIPLALSAHQVRQPLANL
jgi:hypothetical protein